MPIEPTKPGGNPYVSARPPQAAQIPSASGDPKRDEQAPDASGGGRLHLSEAVRELLAQHGVEEIPSGDLSHERLQFVLDRIRQGHYDRPETRGQILGRVLDEFEGRPGSD